MSIEGRLTSLQTKVDQLLDLVKIDRSLLDNPGADTEEHYKPVKSAQAEIRSLELWRSVVAECLGTLCYVFFVCGVSIPWTGHFPPFLSVAFASALAYGALTYRVFPGAHLNPAFTLALTAIKRVSPLRCLLFLTAQAGGAIAGAALLFGLTVPGYQGSLGATTIASHIIPVQAFGLELILSFVMTLTFISDPNNSLPTTAILLAANLVALPCTGAGLNPSRSLGPAFVMNKWPSHWVFWLGPCLGALLAAYLHRFILRRSIKPKKVRENPSDGDSLDLPSADLPTTAPDRLLCERFEPLYGGTRSLYMKPSPTLPRNLNRSQSVYASKRFDYLPKFDLPRKQATPHSGPTPHSYQPDSNYESLYERKHSGGHSGAGNPLLLSGPPSYESGYHKTYENSKSHGHHHHGHGYHQREKSDSHSQHNRDNQTNRILAQYETSKGLVDVDPKAALKAQNKAALYYDTSEMLTRKENMEKKLLETVGGNEYFGNGSSGSSGGSSSNNPPPPPRFRLQTPIQSQKRYQPPGQCATETANDLNRGNGHGGKHGGDVPMAKKPYELLEPASNPNKKLMEFTPIQPAHHPQQQQQQQQQSSQSGNHCSNNYSPRLLMADKDSTYSRILEPIMNSKPPNGNPNLCRMSPGNGNPNLCRVSPSDTLTFSYH